MHGDASMISEAGKNSTKCELETPVYYCKERRPSMFTYIPIHFPVKHAFLKRLLQTDVDVAENGPSKIQGSPTYLSHPDE